MSQVGRTIEPMFLERVRFVDLFAGIGGFHHALSALGGECVLAVEIDPEARHVYRTSFPDTPMQDDLRDLTRTNAGQERQSGDVDRLVPDHDVLCAGFPCQPFSKSGAQEGVRDRTRGTLFFDVMTIVLAKRPRWVILENVRNLAGPRHRDTWWTIVESLRSASYRVPDEPLVLSPHMLPPEHGGAPQVRERVFILAERVDIGTEQDRTGELLVPRAPFPDWDPSGWDVEQFLQPDREIGGLDQYQLRPDEIAWIEAWQAFVQAIQADVLPGFPIWVDAFVELAAIPVGTPSWKRDFLEKNSDFYRRHRHVIDEWRNLVWSNGQRVDDFPLSRRKFEWQARRFQKTRAERDLSKLVLHLRPSGIRVKPPTYLPALVAITQTSIIGSRMRRITPIEAARLQRIPGDVFAKAGVSDSAAYKQLGNAVNAGVVEFLARRFLGIGGQAASQTAHTG